MADLQSDLRKVPASVQQMISDKFPKYGSRYVPNGLLGEGDFGEVVSYYDTVLKRYFAFKIVDLTKMKPTTPYVEVEVLNLLKKKHPSFLEIFDVIKDGNTVTLITEELNGLSLMDEIMRVSTREKGMESGTARIVFRQLLECMAIAHEMNIYHRDLKPENIMFANMSEPKNNNVKIIDWGLAAFVGTEKNLPLSGSPHYAAQEIISLVGVEDRQYNLLGPWNDVWALGCILFSMLTGKMMFDGTYIDIFRKVLEFETNYNVRGLTPSSIRLLKRIFVPYNERATCRELLQDEWLISDEE